MLLLSIKSSVNCAACCLLNGKVISIKAVLNQLEVKCLSLGRKASIFLTSGFRLCVTWWTSVWLRRCKWIVSALLPWCDTTCSYQGSEEHRFSNVHTLQKTWGKWSKQTKRTPKSYSPTWVRKSKHSFKKAEHHEVLCSCPRRLLLGLGEPAPYRAEQSSRQAGAGKLWAHPFLHFFPPTHFFFSITCYNKQWRSFWSRNHK